MPIDLFSVDNHLLQPARKTRVRWPRQAGGLYPFAVMLFSGFVPSIGTILFLFPLLSFSAAHFAGWEPFFDPAQEQFIRLVAGFLPIYFWVWLWLAIFERRRFRTIGLKSRFPLKEYGRGLFVGLLMFSTSIGLLAIFGFVTVETASLEQNGWMILQGAGLLLVAWMIQGAAEEVLIRGFLMPILSVRYGTLLGILLSSLLFALLHLLNPNVSLIAILNLFLFGVFAALYALYEEGLWGVFSIHAIWNWAQGNLYGFEVSGMEIRSAIIFDLKEIGPDWFTGGLFGPEGGIAVTVVLLLSSLVVVVADRQRTRVVSPKEGLSRD